MGADAVAVGASMVVTATTTDGRVRECTVDLRLWYDTVFLTKFLEKLLFPPLLSKVKY